MCSTDTGESYYMNMSQVAEKLGISVDTFTKSLRKGKPFPHDHWEGRITISQYEFDLYRKNEWEERTCNHDYHKPKKKATVVGYAR